MKRLREVVRGRKWKAAMDYDVSPTISTEFLHEEDEASTSVRVEAKLDPLDPSDEAEDSATPQMTRNISGSVESLDSTNDVGCSRILGDIQAGLQADYNAAKVG